MYDEIDEENEETECPRSFDHLLKSTKLVKGQRMELSEFYKANNAKQGLDMLNTLIATDQLNHKLLLDGVKLLALKFASGQCQDGEDNHVRVAVLRKLCDEKLGDNEHIAATVALLLDGCEGRWDRLRPLLAKAVFKTDCFHLLAGMALARHQLNTLETLCNEIEPKVPFSVAPKHPFWTIFLHCLRENSKDRDRLMKLYMDQLVLLDNPLNEFDAQHMKRALAYYNKWRLDFGARVNHHTLECSHCAAKLVPTTIEPQKFAQLRDAMLNELDKGAMSRNRATAAQVVALSDKLREVKQKSVQHQQQRGRPLVIDALNMVGGYPKSEHLGYVRYFIDSLSRNGFSPILAVTRSTFPPAFINTFNGMGVHVFNMRSNDLLIHDDLFTLNAALQLGPDAHLMSNDGFRQHVPSELDASLFFRWVKSRLIRFWVPKVTNKNPEYLLPNTWHSQGDVSNGYHILVERRVHSRQFVSCIRVK